ncbi:MAG: imidazolonepropionase [Chitinophagales bacterium]
MKSTLLTQIKGLAGVVPTETRFLKGSEMNKMAVLENAWLLMEDGLIKDFGTGTGGPERADEIIDCTGKWVLPGFCDSHTHLVFAAPREKEFVAKIQGKTYEEIAAAGGGILNSANHLRNMSELELFEQAEKRITQIKSTGTCSIEIKSGYGLSMDGELKMLRVIRRLKEKFKIPIKATFLGAHALPENFKSNREGYLSMLLNELLPTIANEELADFIDCFCERNYFTVDEMCRIIEAGAKFGLKAKVHVNQFTSSGGVAAAVKGGALSVDHLEELTNDDLSALKMGNTMATALPGCSFFSNIPFCPARKIIEQDLPLAIASDYNPGSAPSGNMQLIWAMACIKLNLLPEEALAAATINGAYAMELSREVGSIAIGKKALLNISKPAPSLAYFPYSFGENWLDRIMY